MRSILAVAALAAVLASSPAEAAAPPVQARAYIVQSSVDGRTLAARDADTPRAMASITKLMTALVAVRRLELDRIVTVPAAATRIGESTLSLRPGQRVTVRDLVIGTLVPSANDAATALAIAAAGELPRFVAAMNAEARRLGLTGTRYRNPHGLDEAGHVSTARDSAKLLREALRVRVLRRYAGAAAARLSNGRWVRSTDNLVGTFGGFVAGKTGHTSLAGWSQVGFAKQGAVGITVTVLGAADRGAARQRPHGAPSLRARELPRRRASWIPRARTVSSPSGGDGPGFPSSRPGRSSARAPAGRPLTEQIVIPAVARAPRRGRPACRHAGRARRQRASSPARRSSRANRGPSRAARRRPPGSPGAPATTSSTS